MREGLKLKYAQNQYDGNVNDIGYRNSGDHNNKSQCFQQNLVV